MSTAEVPLVTASQRVPRRHAGRRWTFWLLCFASIVLLVIAVRPVQIFYHSARGKDLLSSGQVQPALEEFRTSLKLDPERAETHFWLARCFRKLGHIEEVRHHLDEALRLGYSDTERLQHEWWFLQAQSGNMRDTEAHLKDLLRSAGDDGSEICDAFAQGYCLNLRFDAALLLLEAWQADHPSDYRPHFRRGQIYSEDKFQTAKAEGAFREALKLAPDVSAVHRELGKTLLGLQRLDEAAEELRIAAKIDPTDEAALLALAAALKEQKKLPAAADVARRLLNLNPRHERATILLADILLLTGDAEESLQLLTPLAELWPEDLKIQYTLASALQKVGRKSEAAEHLKAYAELETASQHIMELKRSLERNPDDPELRYEFGLLRLRHESRAEGVAWLQSVLLCNPNHAATHEALADYYSKVENFKLAEMHRLRSRELASSQDEAIDNPKQNRYEEHGTISR